MRQRKVLWNQPLRPPMWVIESKITAPVRYSLVFGLPLTTVIATLMPGSASRASKAMSRISMNSDVSAGSSPRNNFV